MSSSYFTEDDMRRVLPFLMIALGAALWGLIAFFVRGLRDIGFTSMEIVTIRVTIAAICLFIIGSIQFRDQLKIKYKDIHLFVGTGILSIVFFNWCYFTAITQMDISIAVILLYTSPAFVTLLSFFFLKEPLYFKKILAVAGTIMGCVLVAGLNSGGSEVSFWGLLIGLGAGLGYALYSIFGKFALKRYEPFTVILYTFVTASIFLLPITGLWKKSDQLFSTEVLFYAIGLGIIPTVLAYFVYTWGLQRTESSKASIIATVEPIVATLLGVFLYEEKLEFVQVLGSLLILISVITVSISFKKNPKKRFRKKEITT